MTFNSDLVYILLIVFAGGTIAHLVVSRLISQSQLSWQTKTALAASSIVHDRPSASMSAAPACRAAIPVPTAAADEGCSTRLSSADQLGRLAGFVHDQAERADNAEQLHGSAGRQLDLAAYALQNLRSEIEGVVAAETGLAQSEPTASGAGTPVTAKPVAHPSRAPLAA